MSLSARTIGAGASPYPASAGERELSNRGALRHPQEAAAEPEGEDEEEPLKGGHAETAETEMKTSEVAARVLQFETGTTALGMAKMSLHKSCSEKAVFHPNYTAILMTRCLDTKGYWAYVAVYILLELGCWAFVGESFFGLLNGGAVESLRLAKKQSMGLSMQVHILGGSALWLLGALQVLCKKWRSNVDGLAWLHRALGRLYLLLWLFVTGPTAAHLSLFVGVGRHRMHWMMTAFAVAGLDTTLLAYYYFWRAWRIARLRTRKGDSLKLHGLAMRTGMAFTLLITYQRTFQLIVLAIQKLYLLLASTLNIDFVQTSADFLNRTVLDSHAVLSWTTLLPGLAFPLLLDGPRSHFMVWLLGLSDRHEEQKELFGTLSPGRLELLLWRARVPLYLILRALVSQGMTREPSETWPGPALGLNSDIVVGSN